ncbi:MAG: dTDP-glucose 4,6-dehydratase [Actinobacteria bacterium]|nr:MAG: dTDP-glucose 4,6-dehydratase [Actinomycetota bacterium]
MKILVTGGAGFIGSNFVRLMLKQHPDYKIINLDKLTYAGNIDNLKGLEDNSNYSFIKGDICDAKLVSEIIDGSIDAVVSFAAESHVDRSITHPDEFVRTNVLGVNNLLNIAKAAKVPRFIQISTDEVYGSIKEGSFKETDCLTPSSPYSSSKAGGDLLAMSYFITYKYPVIITRSSNNFGPYQYPEKLIPLFVTNAMEDKPLPVYGSGENMRDWLYVEDNCRGLDVVLHKGKEGEIYNLGAGNETPNMEITKEILGIMGKPESLITYVDDRLGHDFRYSIAVDKIKELGWQPKRNFKQALEETVKWYLENEWWWRPLKK